MPAIQIENISKSFGAEKAVNEVSFTVDNGELFGLIGPDGAGKTTLFKMLTTLLMPDSGSAWVEGLHTVKDYKKIRNIVGYMPGRFSLYQDLSVKENLSFFATIFGTTIQKNYHLIADIYEQLAPFKKRRASDLSGGMKQKLALCCALVHEPKVLFLDEPTTGVDAVSRMEFWEMLKRLKSKGISILVSTPYMDEAALCERIALMQGGNILQIDTPDKIMASYTKPLFAIRANDFYQLLQDLRQFSGTERVEPFGEYLHLTTHAETGEKEIFDFLTANGHSQLEIKPTAATVEDVFLDLMKTTEK